MASEIKVDTITHKTSGNGVELKAYKETDVTVTSGTTLTIDLNNGNTGAVTLAHNVTDIDFTNVPTTGTCAVTWIVTQDGSSSYTIAIDAVTINGGGNVTAKTAAAAGYTMTADASKVDVISLLFVNGGTPYLSAQQAF